ncbi:MAG TPA: hypothetical protein DCQ06_01260, partial [Myxococcales bacterium]|nr:hypothetical protein [Myxococcales bacterium]
MDHRRPTSPHNSHSCAARRRTLAALVLFWVGLSGCVDDDSTRPTDVAATVDAGTFIDTGVTYAHVAPIFRQYCNSCHSVGGVGPMAFDSYEATKKWAPAIRVSVTERTMPPWLLTGDGSCGEFKDSAWLSEQDVKTIDDWVIGGAQPGEVEPVDQQPIKLSELSGDNVIELKMPVTYGPQANKPTNTGAFDDYRCFPIQTGLDKDVFVTATEVIPGDPSIVHHVLVFSVNPLAFPVDAPEFGSNEKVMQSLDSTNNDRPGWPCFAAAGQGVLMDSLLVAWAPGEDVNRYPMGTGLQLPKGNILVMQVHYNVLGGVKTDRTRIRLAIEDEVDRPAWMALH